jgi:hypothetical protein
MNSARSNPSILALGIRGLSACCGLSASTVRRTTPPPKFLCLQNQAHTLSAGEAPMLASQEAKMIPLNPVKRTAESVKPAILDVPRNSGGLLSRGLNWLRAHQAGRSSNRRLHVEASVSLGDKRFIAVVQVDGLQFLIGGGATNVALLAELKGKESFEDLLKETLSVQGKEPAVRSLEQVRESA